jgi:hypothetical protein
MPLSKGSKEFIALLNSHGVEYLIVGAHSLAFHARPVFFLSKILLIANKRAVGRPQDLADLTELE